MGKKSRKGGKKGNKKAHKEKVQERRSRVEEHLDYGDAYDDDDDGVGDSDRDAPFDPFLEGDRVWFWDAETSNDDDPNTYRGIVKTITLNPHDELNNKFEILPLAAEAETMDRRIVRLQRQVVADKGDWTLRFGVGDKVVCDSGDAHVLCTVCQLYPPDFIKRPDCQGEFPVQVPAYKCKKITPDNSVYGYLMAPYDDDDAISKHPQSFRFSVGDRVVFAANKALAIPSRCGRISGWVEGTVSGVDILSRSDFYAAYKCEFQHSGRVATCFIAQDDDSHIAALCSNPRDRLMEAIEQGCDYDHIDAITKDHDIDVSAFQAIVLARAVEYGNYWALLWLQEFVSVDLHALRDNAGNNILHKIASSPHAARFIQIAGMVENREEQRKIIHFWLHDSNIENMSLFEMMNDAGETMFHILIRRGDTRALDLLLSPRQNGMGFSVLTLAPRNLFSTLIEFSRLMNQIEMARIIEEYQCVHTLYRQVQSLRFSSSEGEQELLKNAVGCDSFSEWQEDDRIKWGMKVVRFCDEWQNSCATMRSRQQRMIEEIVFQLSRFGFHRFLRVLLEVDDQLLFPESKVDYCNVNADEFIQAELYDDEKQKEISFELVSVATHGKVVYLSKPDRSCRLMFSSLVRNYLYWSLGEKKVPWLDMLKGRLSENSAQYHFQLQLDFQQLLKYKIKLLQDDEDLDERLKVLEFLVKEKQQPRPSPLDPIRFRQCGVLRWMVKESLIELTAAAKEDRQLFKAAKELQFLGSQNIPTALTVGYFLCFATVEYDDLQSLQWLSHQMGVEIEDVQVNGWNLVHACAFFGRIEILAWLVDESAWHTLVESPCRRKPWEKAYAAHVAIDRGHIMAADILLDHGCPSTDGKGKTADYYAVKSILAHVRSWGEDKARPFRIEKDVNKLLRSLSEEKPITELKAAYLRSRCLDYDVWPKHSFDVPGPGGKMYVEVLRECCESQNMEFAVWLCGRLSFEIGEDANGSCHCWSLDSFWGKYHTFIPSTLDTKVPLTADKDVNRWLSLPWAQGCKVSEPIQQSPVLAFLWKQPGMEELCRKLREQILVSSIIKQVRSLLSFEIAKAFARGDTPENIDALRKVFIDASERFCVEEYLSAEARSRLYSSHLIADDGSIRMDANVDSAEYKETSPAYKMALIQGQDPPNHLSNLAYVLAIEGHADLVRWCFRQSRAWDGNTDFLIVRTASYFGHEDIVGFFLCDKERGFQSSKDDRVLAAMLGATEGGRASALEAYLQQATITPSDILVTHLGKLQTRANGQEKRNEMIYRSLAMAGVAGFLNSEPVESSSSNDFGDERIETLQVLVDILGYDAKIFLYAAQIILDNSYSPSIFYAFERLFPFLLSNKLEVFDSTVEELLHQISMRIMLFSVYMDKENMERLLPFASGWFDTLVSLGLSIQSAGYHYHGKNGFRGKLETARKSQVESWEQFHGIKHNHTLQAVREAIESGVLPLEARDQGGMMLAHVAAAYDRLDVLEWLVAEKNVDLDSIDGKGRNVLQVAEASKAPNTTLWIKQREARRVISSFLATHFHRHLAAKHKKRMTAATTKLQARYRGRAARKTHRVLLVRLGEAHRFRAIWARSSNVAIRSEGKTEPCTWSQIREKEFDMRHADGDKILVDEALSEAVSSALNVVDEHLDVLTVSDGDDGDSEARSSGSAQVEEITSEEERGAIDDDAKVSTCIQLSSNTVKWLRKCDEEYRSFFVKRMAQLASGHRSRALAKRLKGSKSGPVYESKLESGHRILWTPPTGSGDDLIVWYVTPHKHITRFMRLIDDSQSRSARQRMPVASALPELALVGLEASQAAPAANEKHILLDPHGNVPLKLYQVPVGELQDITDPSWTPKLRLTDEEREVVQGKGTILLLGRSGTGKTICICNRMDWDRLHYAHNPSFSQLFVARSARLCRYVEETIGSQSYCTFYTFGEVLRSLQAALPAYGGNDRIFLPSQRVTFARFKRDVYGGDKSGLDPLVVWTNIRTFIKGSIEATEDPDSIMSRECYLEEVGRKRCRLSSEQREAVYDIFLRYQKYTSELSLWDDCDRVISLLRRVIHAETSDPGCYERVRKSKIYVDEIQDYLQCEIALFFHLSGPGDLFLAGDPAQSVVEGTDFRFEEIRAVGYHIAGSDRRNLIPQKPKTVNINFRSHSGILNTAAAILQCLFDVFPGSAKQLKKDRGLFRGPRPGVLHKVDSEYLAALISDKLNGAVILTHDSNASHWKRRLGYPLVYGICEAKGLEFKSVILLDFFVDLPHRLQKPWRDMLLGRTQDDFNESYPEIEARLKMLYTSVTRCIEQLFFAETATSIAGEAFVRWITTTSTKSATANTAEHQLQEALATRNNVENVETMVMTRDEWLASGLNNAEMAESGTNGDLSKQEALLERAIYCFEQAKDDAFASKARAHRSSIRFRMELPDSTDDDDEAGESIEIQAALIVEHLLTEQLLSECREFCLSILPYLSPYTREHLERDLISKLPSYG